ncbi:MAG: protein kinase [Blautia sp.]|nr:protein kinase [Blautia sp.]
MSGDFSDTYQIIEKIGEGNSGEIFKAYHKNLGKYVVLKKIKAGIKDLVNNRAEVDVLKNLRHSCLPQVLDFLEIDGDVYTVMDYIPGHSFKEYLDAGTSFPEKSVYIWTKQICATLCYLHGQNPPIIHSDLKPGNIMLMPDGNICLIDFNISASLDGNTAWVTGYTNGYAAPEQIKALKYNQNELNRSLWKKIDGRADIYSLGATIYHILTGQKPEMDEEGYVDDIREQININDVFGSIIMKCLEPDPSRRYQTAGELLSDLQNIHKKDKRYKALLTKQKGTYILVALCMILCTGLTVTGYLRMDTDKQKEYEQLVAMESQCSADKDYDNLETYYQKAVRLCPDDLEAYYQKAVALNQKRQYGECIDFISSEILSNQKIMSKAQTLNNIYYILGDSYEKLQDYESAGQNYEKAIEIDPENSSYYRDYAIMLAYCGKMEDTRKILNEARDRGLDSVQVNYVEGEVLYNSGEYDKAKNIFLDCIQKSKDSYIQMRAYIMAAKCIQESENNSEGKMKVINLLEKARNSLPKEDNIGVLEELAQIYSDLGNEKNDSSWYKKAISIFNQIENQGMADYDTEYNLAVLYQNIQDYGKAAELMNQILQEYGEDYRTYKGLAFLEVAKQSKTVMELRDYRKFQDYYLKAEDLYQAQLANNENDMEMERLEDLYNQAISKGWISG